MAEMPWVRFFASDWLGGTRSMSAAETGIYITLIATMYERGEPIKEDHARLARLCGTSNSSFKKCLEALILEGKITRSEEGLWNDRVQKEVSYRLEKSEVGSQAAKVRWGEKTNKNNARPNAKAMPTHSERIANQKPYKKEVIFGVSKGSEKEMKQLDRWMDESLFKACETLMGITVPDYQQTKSFPASIVEAATQKEIENAKV